MKTGAKKEEKKGEGGRKRGRDERRRVGTMRSGTEEGMDGRTTSTASNPYLIALSFSSTDSQG